MKIESVKLADLELDEANVLDHEPGDVGAIARSLAQFGQQKPIVISADGWVAAGNGTVLAARSLGWTTIKAHRSKLSGIKLRAYSVADNKTGRIAEWNDANLVARLEEARQHDEELLRAMAYTGEELAGLLEGWETPEAWGEAGGNGELVDPEPQIDRAAELQKEWGTELGQLWEIPGKAGVHRLLCGDSTKRGDVERVIDGAVPFLMVTDPPYGVQYKPEGRAGLKAVGLSGRKRGHIVGDEEANWQESWELSPATVAYVWCASLSIHKVVPGLLAAKLEYRALIVWAKQKFVCGRSHYQWAHETCIYATRGAAKWLGGRGESTVWQINNAQGYMTNQAATEHPTEKPLECMRRPIRNHGGDGDAVYDPFLGSGTTMVAAEQLSRVCYGIEIAPQYVAVALQRMKDLGLEPRLAS